MNTSRLPAVDALRGCVMLLMALDHVRDFFHNSAAVFSPTDLTQTTAFLFFTRWVTHFCLPVFMFTAGAGAFLYGRTRTLAQLRRFLWTRGLWFVFLELTVMQVAYNFNLSFRPMLLLLILWIFGACMLILSALVNLPVHLLAIFAAAVILLHNCLDSIQAPQFQSAAWLWNLLHQPGVFVVAGRPVLIGYPVLPWIAVMAAGYTFAPILLLTPDSRRRILFRTGLALTAAFLLLRALNLYGDPAPWTHQSSPVFTLLSFLNCTKYPASLDFLLMTLGPALLFLAYLDRLDFQPSNPLIVFGRVPMFYFVLHFYLIHLLVVVAAWLRYGNSAFRFIFSLLPSMGGARELFPPRFGYPLWVVYAVWLLTLALLYPACRWFVKIKRTRRDWWLSYL